MIDRLVGARAAVDRCRVIRGVTRQIHCKHKRKRVTATQPCRQRLTGLIGHIHAPHGVPTGTDASMLS